MQKSSERIYHEVIEMGVSFIDELYVDESNSVGRSITRDYSAAIVHIRFQYILSKTHLSLIIPKNLISFSENSRCLREK